jgi:uncharacterized protein YlxW (UPF0749 family)
MPSQAVEGGARVRRGGFSLVLMTVLMFVLGIMIVVQFRAAGRLRPVSGTGNEQAILLSALADANSGLRAEVASLTAQEAGYEREKGTAGLEELVAELNRVRVLNGMVEVSGPGTDLLLDGPLNALDLQDVVNELRNAGAEAITLNGRRLVVNSVMAVDAKGQVLLNGQPIVRPYQFVAIGDPDTLETAVRRSGGLLSILQRTYPNLIVQTAQHARVVMGMQRAQSTFRYAQAVE